MKTAVIAITEEGLRIGSLLGGEQGFHLYVPERIARMGDNLITYSEPTSALVRSIWKGYDGFVFIMPVGAVVRLIKGLIRDKHTDPAVVVLDEMARYSVSLLSGHEGGANMLSARVARICGAEPVITTGRETRKRLVVGMGCRGGTTADTLERALKEALSITGRTLDEVRLISTIEGKKKEEAIHTVSERLGIPVVFIPEALVLMVEEGFEKSELAKKSVGVYSVAEPCAVLGGKRCTLILPKTRLMGSVTVAIAEEGSL